MYADKTNAENKIVISKENRESLVFGPENTIEVIAEQILSKNKQGVNAAIEAWYGVPVKEFALGLSEKLKEKGLKTEVIFTNEILKSAEQVKEYKKQFITEDPSFGYVNMDGRIEDIMDEEKLQDLRKKLLGNKDKVIILAGCGAMTSKLQDLFAVNCFMDITREPMLWKMWDGKLIPLGMDVPDQGYQWKEYYYCDYYLLHFQKNYVLTKMDYYLEAIEYNSLKLIPRPAYDEILSTLVKYPIKQVKEFQPGPWGAYRYKDLFQVPGLECNAWNRLASPELGVLIDVGCEEMLNVPLISLMQYGKDLCGEYLNKTYPDLFPMEIWLDDGYFSEPQPAERISMPIHNHPGSSYVKEHFNEPLGRYETYYIAEAYEGANTWMGFKDDADLEAWETKCRESENLVPIEDWKEYITNHVSNEGDLYLIPPGTVHGHGGNQMVLEMDTCPSIAGTEYSFFEYDFARKTWDDSQKTMTGKPMKMHLEHGFNNEKWVRESYVNENLRASKKVIEWNKEYSKDQYSTLPQMPFMIERLHFYEKAGNNTDNRFMHILTLTVGTRVKIASKKNPELFTYLNRLQSAIIPASFGDYEIINEDGGFSTIVQFRWKKG